MYNFFEDQTEINGVQYYVHIDEDHDDSGPVTFVAIQPVADVPIPRSEYASIRNAVRARYFDNDPKLLISFSI